MVNFFSFKDYLSELDHLIELFTWFISHNPCLISSNYYIKYPMEN